MCQLKVSSPRLRRGIKPSSTSSQLFLKVADEAHEQIMQWDCISALYCGVPIAEELTHYLSALLIKVTSQNNPWAAVLPKRLEF